MKMKNKLTRYACIFVALSMTAAMIVFRFMHPDMTAIRWLIEFWYIWLAWIVIVPAAGYLATKDDPDGG
jgi:hypothetical protein